MWDFIDITFTAIGRYFVLWILIRIHQEDKVFRILSQYGDRLDKLNTINPTATKIPENLFKLFY